MEEQVRICWDNVGRIESEMIFKEQYPKYREQHITNYAVGGKLVSLAVALEDFILVSIGVSRLTLELFEIQHGADLP